MIKIKEIKAGNMNGKQFIDDKVRAIRQAVGDGLAVNALSRGVDSCVSPPWDTGLWAIVSRPT